MGIKEIITLVETIRTDLEELATERREAAANEHIWGNGSDDAEAKMHFENEALCKIAANFFEAIAKPEVLIALIEEYAEA